MSRQIQCPSNECCCLKDEYGLRPSSRYVSRRDPSDEENEYFKHNFQKSKLSSYDNQVHNTFVLDDESWNAISALRRRACQPLRSDTENITARDTACLPCTCRTERSASLLRKANDLIDYTPESEFLKKMKQQCQKLQDRQPNIFSTLDEIIVNDYPSYECRKCSNNSVPSSRREEQFNTDRFRSEPNRMCKCFGWNQQSEVNTSDNDDVLYKKVGQNRKNIAQNRNVESKTKEQLKGKKQPTENSKNAQKKSEHVSRSKKPVKCRGRRKRKSASSEKCEPEDQFEPTLKKPHENSCERCWRYASPARSPVNKPDQRYDPNFRRGHSCIDFEKGDGDLEIYRVSPCKNLQPITDKEKDRPPTPSRDVQHKSKVVPPASSAITKEKSPIEQPTPGYSSAKVKELRDEYSSWRPLDKSFPRMQALDDSRLKKPDLQASTGILYSDPSHKPRPKSYTPGMPFVDVGRFPSTLDDLNLTRPEDVCLKPRGQMFDMTDFNSKSLRIPIPRNSIPTTFEESDVKNLRVRSASRAFDHFSLQPVPEVDTPPPKEDKNSSSKAKSPKTPKNLGTRETTHTNSPVRTENLSSKSSKPCSPKTPAAGATKKGKPKSSSPKPSTPKREVSKSPKKSPQPPKSPKENSKKNDTLHESRDKVSADKEESRPTDIGLNETSYYQVHDCGTAEQSAGSHPIRHCNCYPRIPNLKGSESQSGHIFCCHCDWEERVRNHTDRCSYKTHCVAQPNNEENEGLYPAPKPESNERQSLNKQELLTRSCDCRYVSPLRSTSPESSFILSPRDDITGRVIACPYRRFFGKEKPLSTRIMPNSGRSVSWENERRPSKEYRNISGGQEASSPECSPRKYFVFYMTKSKEDRGKDDVEVLVEELSQACPNTKDSRTKDITEKMKKIMECPSDSMALRFQKGVSEACKTPHSSRILYF